MYVVKHYLTYHNTVRMQKGDSMRNIDDFLDGVKAVTGSDYRTGAILKTGRQMVSNWRTRRSFPSNKAIIQLCEIADIDLKAAILAVEYSREYERPIKEAGFADVGMLCGMSLAGVTGVLFSHGFIDLASAFAACYTLCETEELEQGELNRLSAANDEVFERSLSAVV